MWRSEWVIHPESRRIWDIITMLLVVYTALWIPFVVAFAPQVPAGMVIFDSLVDLIFLTDVVFNMFTGFFDRRTRALVTDRRLIARSYLLGWFVVDIVSAIPVDLISLAVSPENVMSALDSTQKDESSG